MARLKTMGRKKTDPPGHPYRQAAIVVKGNPEWKDWIERTAAKFRMNVSMFVEFAVIEYAKNHGQDEESPAR